MVTQRKICNRGDLQVGELQQGNLKPHRLHSRVFEQAPSMGESETVSALSDLLNSQPVSARQAAEIAAEMEIDLRYGTLSGYWAGKHGRPTHQSLAKLAAVIPSLTEKQLQEAAWNTSSPLGPYSPPDEAIHLSERQRRALDELIRSVVAIQQGQSHVVEATAQSDASTEAEQVEEVSVSDGAKRTPLVFRTGKRATTRDDRAKESE